MELPSCPACHQSVLDDEADLCPFCGAPLKKSAPAAAATKSASRPATSPTQPAASRPASAASSTASPSAPASRPTSPSKPATTARSSKPSSDKTPSAQNKSANEKLTRSAADDALEESFNVDSSAGFDGPVASRQRSQSRPYKVRCPMCDTVGYIPRSAAGKEIRCANRDCMVPVFVAPRPEKKKEVEGAPPKRLTPARVMMALACIPLLAYAAYNFYANWGPEIKAGQKPPVPIPPKGDPAVPKPDEKTQPIVATHVVQKPLKVNEERGAALALMARASQDNAHNRSRPLCERLVAHTAADCGDLEMATTFIQQLQNAENGLSFYRVPPLTSTAWRQLKIGDRDAAKKTLDDALKSTAELPSVGRFSIDSAAWLAAALTAGGRDSDARSLAQRFPSTGAGGRLSAAAARASAWSSCDIDRADQERLFLDAPSFQLPVVVETVVAMGYPAEALRLAQSISGPGLQAECEVAWLVAVERAKSPKADKTAALARLKPAAQARSHAQFGLLRLRNNDREGAQAELQLALASLGSAKPGPALEVPSLKEIHDWQPTDPSPARQDALAFAEIARLQAGLGQAEAANRGLATALDCVRASAPSPVAVDLKLKAAKTDRAGLQAELRATLKLSEAKTGAAFNQYRQNLTSLGKAADARFDLEVEILDASLAWADPAAVWKLIGSRATAADFERREPYFITPLPWQLLVRLETKGEKPDEGTSAAIDKAIGETRPNPLAFVDKFVAEAGKTKPDDLANRLKSKLMEDVDRSDRERAALVAADRLVSSGQFDKAFEFARKIEDPVMKEETMQWTAALACRLGQARPVKDALLKANSSFLPTELIAAWRGFLVGLLARERAEPAAASAAPPASKPSASRPTGEEDSKRAEASKG